MFYTIPWVKAVLCNYLLKKQNGNPGDCGADLLGL